MIGTYTWIGVAVAVVLIVGWFIVDSWKVEPYDTSIDDLLTEMRAEEARWTPVWRRGCHEYQQHVDGRRRAVRIVKGDCPLATEWLDDGLAVPVLA